jgi:GNAT superfamily N-acetyltransferase
MRVEIYQDDRTALMPLFRLAEDSESELMAYIGRGEVLVAREGGGIIGHVQIVGTDDENARELKSMAVRQAHQRRGVGRVLVDAAIDHCRKHGVRRLIVATAAADIGNLRFYQRQGFRLLSVERDAFGPLNGYRLDAHIDGIPLRDRVVLDLALQDPVGRSPT